MRYVGLNHVAVMFISLIFHRENIEYKGLRVYRTHNRRQLRRIVGSHHHIHIGDFRTAHNRVNRIKTGRSVIKMEFHLRPGVITQRIGGHQHPLEKLRIELCGAAWGILSKHERQHHSHIHHLAFNRRQGIIIVIGSCLPVRLRIIPFVVRISITRGRRHSSHRCRCYSGCRQRHILRGRCRRLRPCGHIPCPYGSRSHLRGRRYADILPCIVMHRVKPRVGLKHRFQGDTMVV